MRNPHVAGAISYKSLYSALAETIERRDYNAIEILKHYPFFNQIPSFDLNHLLYSALYNGDERIAHTLRNAPSFLRLTPTQLGELGEATAYEGHVELLETTIKTHPQFGEMTTKQLVWIFQVAAEYDNSDIITVFKDHPRFSAISAEDLVSLFEVADDGVEENSESIKNVFQGHPNIEEALRIYNSLEREETF